MVKVNAPPGSRAVVSAKTESRMCTAVGSAKFFDRFQYMPVLQSTALKRKYMMSPAVYWPTKSLW
jgi:hypothetical protein